MNFGPATIRRLLAGVFFAFFFAFPVLAAGSSSSAAADFPPPLEVYRDPEGANLREVLAARIATEPLNLIATLLFLGAIIHTFVAPSIARYAHRLAHHPSAGEDDLNGNRSDPGPVARSFRAEMLHFLGEIEAVFGIWVVPLIAVIAVSKGWPTVDAIFQERIHFTEPLFVVVIMAISSTRPVLQFAEQAIGKVATLFGGSSLAWWWSILTVGPILGSFITEPAAMVISALLLSRKFYTFIPSPRLAYGTLGLLFVNVSVGGTFTHFAAPPVLMVAGRWGWDTAFMVSEFGYKALLGIVVSNALYALFFRRDLRELSARAQLAAVAPAEPRPPVPAWVVIIHLGFLGWTVWHGHTPALFLGGFLFFLAFFEATSPHQDPLKLRSPLLVGFFLGGLVTHGAFQQWWIAPVLGRLSEFPLFLGSIVLTAFNDNAAITYLASLVPTFDEALRYAVVAGAVTGGGLTVIANAPNPAGQSVLNPHFGGAISPLGLLGGALLPTVVLSVAFFFLP